MSLSNSSSSSGGCFFVASLEAACRRRRADNRVDGGSEVFQVIAEYASERAYEERKEGGAIEPAIECRGVGGGPIELSILLEGSDENPMLSTCS
jgi:hypothetical protein